MLLDSQHERSSLHAEMFFSDQKQALFARSRLQRRWPRSGAFALFLFFGLPDVSTFHFDNSMGLAIRFRDVP
jgi:hypothetical protein